MAMEPLVLVCEGCQVRIRATDPAKARRRECPRCATPLAPAVDRALGVIAQAPPVPRRSPIRLATGTVAVLVTMGSVASLAFRDTSTGAATGFSPGPVAHLVVPSEPTRPRVVEPAEPEPETPVDDSNARRLKDSVPLRPPAEIPPPPPALLDPERPPAAPVEVGPSLPAGPRRVLVIDRKGQAVVAREHGMLKDRMAVLLPDGQIDWVAGRVFTQRPFVPATMNELRETLLADPEFATFKVLQTAHYLVFYQGSRPFAQASADLLERLHDGLTGALRKHGLPVAPMEFPLVAMIFATEDEFRFSRRVAPDVQAYYEILSNRIYFYEKSRRDQESPEVSALRKPQTVAHEGTHQILHNVGLQPRLSDWPLWLVEGFAEYCSPPKATKKGVDWAGLGQVNPIHMATIRDLDDPMSTQIKGPRSVAIGRDRGTPLVEYLVTRKDLTPTDYALSWALTHYLARERVPDFVAYMKRMSELKPFEERTPSQQLDDFRAVFGDDLAKMDGKVARYLSKLKMSDALPYFAVIFEQPVGPMVRRMAMVSQSPSVIRQWLESATAPEGGPSHWQALPHRSRATAVQAAEQWMTQGR
jgi:hypothetical protein